MDQEAAYVAEPPRSTARTYEEALSAFLAGEGDGWTDLPFFREARAGLIVKRLDQLAAEGHRVLPSPADVFNAPRLTPLDRVRVVILGQDPYPTPGDAHGLSFSVNHGGMIPRSLANIFRELKSDLGAPVPAQGDLTPWTRQGVLLLNAVLTVEAREAASHRRLGWQALTDQMIRAVSDRAERAVFILWGADAQAKREMIDRGKHLLIESPHPSPLSASRGFFGSKPFSRTNDWLADHGLAQIDWRL
jgi:uracil-DNA glycosylase